MNTKAVWGALVLLLFVAATAYGQVQGGTISGVAHDEQGGVMPGATVSAQGVDATYVFTTEANGRFRFLNLAPGPYSVSVALSGFTTSQVAVVVALGKATDLDVTLKIAPVTETVVVSAAPLLDARPKGTATNFTIDELARVPTSRDPFSLIRAVPGALVDRVNVAGNETG